MRYMIQVVGLEIGITCKRLLAVYSEKYYPLRLYLSPALVFNNHYSPAPLFELAPLLAVLRYYIFNSHRFHIIVLIEYFPKMTLSYSHSHPSFDYVS